MLQGFGGGIAGNKKGMSTCKGISAKNWSLGPCRSLSQYVCLMAVETAGADGRFRSIAGSAESPTFKANLGL